MLTQRREPSDKLQPGSRLGKYELLKRLATGGMAEIYLARLAGIEGFQKLVVLKRILPRLAESAEFVTMFLDEARLSAALEHPNIAQVHDIGHDDDGNYYFTMEFVHGEDLRNIRKQCASLKRPLPLEHALGIVIGAAAGLHAAHEQTGFDGRPLGIVHRDVSPSNILVSFDGCIKLVDFGVARAEVRQAAQTRVGTIKGKAAYLSPEQCRGQAVDRRSDVFALGTLLYLLTTGRRPFDASSELLLLEQIANARFSRPSEATGGRYPARLEAIVMKALSIEPERRYPTAQALQADVEGFARQHSLPVSSIELGRFMRDLFSEKLTLWRLISRDLGTSAARPALAPVPAREPLPDLAEETELISRGSGPPPMIVPWNLNGSPELGGDDGDSPVSVPPDLTTPVTRVVVPWQTPGMWRLIAMFAAVLAACFVLGVLVARTLIQ